MRLKVSPVLKEERLSHIMQRSYGIPTAMFIKKDPALGEYPRDPGDDADPVLAYDSDDSPHSSSPYIYRLKAQNTEKHKCTVWS